MIREDPRPGVKAGVHTLVLDGLTVDPSVYVAFSPSQMLAYPVGGQSRLSPFVAGGPFGDGQYCCYISEFPWPVLLRRQEAQTALSGEYGTPAIALAITWRILDKHEH